jgi:hypothetical protein
MEWTLGSVLLVSELRVRPVAFSIFRKCLGPENFGGSMAGHRSSIERKGKNTRELVGVHGLSREKAVISYTSLVWEGG